LKGERFAATEELFEIVASAQHGNVQAVVTTMKRVGVDRLLDARPSCERRLVLGVIAARILEPQSKLATTRWWHVTTLPALLGVDEADGAARVAALRETLEETGLAVGWPGLAEKEVAEVRRALLDGTLLSDILAARGDRIALESFVPFARWCPNFKEARTFDTRFYAVAAPPHSHELTVEEAEHSHIFWASAEETLAMADRGEVSVIFPTRRNLERIAQATDFAGFSVHSRQFPVELVTPWVEDREGQSYLCIPAHLGYPVTSESFDRVRRG